MQTTLAPPGYIRLASWRCMLHHGLSTHISDPSFKFHCFLNPKYVHTLHLLWSHLTLIQGAACCMPSHLPISQVNPRYVRALHLLWSHLTLNPGARCCTTECPPISEVNLKYVRTLHLLWSHLTLSQGASRNVHPYLGSIQSMSVHFSSFSPT